MIVGVEQILSLGDTGVFGGGGLRITGPLTQRHAVAGSACDAITRQHAVFGDIEPIIANGPWISIQYVARKRGAFATCCHRIDVELPFSGNPMAAQTH